MLGIDPTVLSFQAKTCALFFVAGYHLVKHKPNPYDSYRGGLFSVH